VSNEDKSHNEGENSINVMQKITIELPPVPRQQYIVTTSDRLKLCLLENLKRAEKKHDWVAPFGVLLAIITSFVTATFRDAFLPAKTWEGVFILLGVGSFVWLSISLKGALYKIDIDNIIKEIQNEEKRPKQPTNNGEVGTAQTPSTK